jgi:hypothetical protein
MTVVTIQAPCCWSKRTCRETYKIVYDIVWRRVVKVITAVRCYRGEKYTVDLILDSPNKYIVAEIYWSTRGNVRVNIEYCPQVMTTNECREIILKHLGLIVKHLEFVAENELEFTAEEEEI